jgi:hypothetical protein
MPAAALMPLIHPIEESQNNPKNNVMLRISLNPE